MPSPRFLPQQSLFHGTSLENSKEILKSGWQVREGKPAGVITDLKGIFFSPLKSEAERYCQSAERAVVIEVLLKTPNLVTIKEHRELKGFCDSCDGIVMPSTTGREVPELWIFDPNRTVEIIQVHAVESRKDPRLLR